MNNKKSEFVGIDLGTTTSCVAYVEEGESTPIVIKNRDSGRNITPSAVFVKSKDEIIVGQEALNERLTNPDRIFTSIKRHMGTDFSKELDGVKYSPELVSSYILRKVVSYANDYFGKDIKNCVITVPAYFTEAQRQATLNAGRLANLNVHRIINEPTAAALCYFSSTKLPDNSKILVYDLGGGTFDVTILEAIGDLSSQNGVIRVLSTAGDNRLGGDDFDKIIENLIVNEIEKATGIKVKKDIKLLARIQEVAIVAKEKLSFVSSYKINLPFVTSNYNYERTLTRAEFVEKCKHLCDKTMKCVEEALKAANLTSKDIARVALVGGSTRMPWVSEKIKAFFGFDPDKSQDPDCVVAQGAAIQANIIAGGETFAGITLVDVTPLSLGIRDQNDKMVVLIPNNSPIPTSHKELFMNVVDNQPMCKIEVYQGQRAFVADNHFLGSFDLKLTPMPRYQAKVEVEMSVDVNSLVKVVAKDLNSGISESIELKTSRDLSPEQIREMFESAKRFAEQDKEREQIVALKSEADNNIYILETLAKNPNINSTQKEEINKLIGEARVIISNSDIKKEQLNELNSKLASLRDKVQSSITDNTSKPNTSSESTTSKDEDGAKGSFEEIAEEYNKNEKDNGKKE